MTKSFCKGIIFEFKAQNIFSGNNSQQKEYKKEGSAEFGTQFCAENSDKYQNCRKNQYSVFRKAGM